MNIIKVVIVLASLFAAFWAIEDRYFTTVAAKEMQNQTIKTMEQLRQQINEDALRQLLDRLLAERRILKRELKQNPEDVNLQEEYQEILEQIGRVRARLEKYR